MMNFILRSPKPSATYESLRWHNSQTVPGVSFGVRKVSLANRLELIRRVRELCLRHEFLRAGDAGEQSEAAIGELMLKELYLHWGLSAIRGLRIDGEPATTELLINRGCEDLVDEVLERIRYELGLNEQERKNS